MIYNDVIVNNNVAS